LTKLDWWGGFNVNVDRVECFWVARAVGGRLALAVMSKSNPTPLNVPYNYGTVKFFFEGFSRTSREWLARESDGRNMEAEKWGRFHWELVIENWSMAIWGFDRIDKINRDTLNNGASGLRGAQGIISDGVGRIEIGQKHGLTAATRPRCWHSPPSMKKRNSANSG